MKRQFIYLGLIFGLLGCSGTSNQSADKNEEVSGNLYDFNVSIAGTVYEFPTTIATFEKNGWRFMTETMDKNEVYPNQETSMRFEKEEAVLALRIQNPASTPVPMEECVVVGLNANRHESIWSEIVLSKGITTNSTLAQLKEAFDEPTYDSNSSKRESYGFQMYYCADEGNNDYYTFSFPSEEEDAIMQDLTISNASGAEELMEKD